MCGGTTSRGLRSLRLTGLSPRVRGNRAPQNHLRHRLRSIPACAGEPMTPSPLKPLEKVYPRVCGGTGSKRWNPRAATGLSPRVRGNLLRPGRTSIPPGSIPACAGEPWAASLNSRTSTVYPRVCGGTANVLANDNLSLGLSPRVRGNLHKALPQVRRFGSIPACAGEPATNTSSVALARVYPRVCGGTTPKPVTRREPAGLSPRVRGNPYWAATGLNNNGSIPACAGEPCPAYSGGGLCRVYPRVCGGTCASDKEG